MSVFKLRPLVSVITPIYNGQRFIKRCIESVARQDYPVEHLIVDDCSTDNSWALLQKLKDIYPWVKPIRLDCNSGPSVARNRAIKFAQGRFLAFLDVDDFWLPHKLQTQVHFMLTKGCVLSFSDYRFVSEDARSIGRCISGPEMVDWKAHHRTRYLGCLTIILDYEKFSDFSMPDISPAIRAEDFLSWAQCIERFGPALRCPYDLARYSVVPNSRSYDKKGAISVWRLYRKVERIPLFLAIFYFLNYSFNVIWKRYWNRPFLKREKIDLDYEWSLLP